MEKPNVYWHICLKLQFVLQSFFLGIYSPITVPRQISFQKLEHVDLHFSGDIWKTSKPQNASLFQTLVDVAAWINPPAHRPADRLGQRSAKQHTHSWKRQRAQPVPSLFRKPANRPASQLISLAARHPQDWWHDGNMRETGGVRGGGGKLTKAFLLVTANIVVDAEHFTQFSGAAEGHESTAFKWESDWTDPFWVLINSSLVKKGRKIWTRFPFCGFSSHTGPLHWQTRRKRLFNHHEEFTVLIPLMVSVFLLVVGTISGGGFKGAMCNF